MSGAFIKSHRRNLTAYVHRTARFQVLRSSCLHTARYEMEHCANSFSRECEAESQVFDL